MNSKKNSMAGKKAVIYYGGFLSKAGGVTVHAKTLNLELQKMGWNVSIISLENIPILCRYIPHLIEKSVNLFYKPLGFFYKGLATRFFYKLFFDIKAEISIFEDIYLYWNKNTPSVVFLHAVWSDNLQSFVVESKLLNRLKELECSLINNINHSIITVSQPYLRYLSEVHYVNYSLPEINVVELGLDLSNFKFAEDSKLKQKSIVYCGALEARKNVLFLLKVFKKIHEFDSDYRLTIIGEGPEKTSLLNYVNDFLNLNISFLGRLSHERVLSELTNHGIYIHTSTKESFSFSLLEAKLSGLKTIAYSGLEVPQAFIDIGIDRFEIEDWCNAILGISWEVNKFNSTYYSAERMTIATLKLLR